MKTMKLNNGVEMPMLGLGTYQVRDAGLCSENVLTAIKAGYRLIDTAQQYGNEEAVGAGINAALKEGIVKREELFVTTKAWFKDYETEDCIRGLESSFKKLGVEYIDMVLLHWPFGNVYAAWRVLEKYYEQGRIRAIGVSNMRPDRFIDLAAYNKITPAVNQIETHLYCQRREDKVWLEKYGIAHQAYTPLGQGRANEMFEEAPVKAFAQKYGKTPAQVLLRFLVQGNVAVIPKSVHEDRLKENIDIFDFELTDEEMRTLEALDKNAPMIGRAEDPVRTEESYNWS